jgi:hypothetical protein
MNAAQLGRICEEATVIVSKESPGLEDRERRIVELGRTHQPTHYESPTEYLRRLNNLARDGAPEVAGDTTTDALFRAYRGGIR